MSIAEIESVELAPGGEAHTSGGSLGRDVIRRLVHSPVALIGAVVILLFLFIAIFAPLLAPHSPTETDQRAENHRASDSMWRVGQILVGTASWTDKTLLES